MTTKPKTPKTPAKSAEIADDELDAVQGGGEGTLTITDSTISGNSANYQGDDDVDTLKSGGVKLRRG